MLFAMAGLQKPKVLWGAWEALWLRDLPSLSPVAVTGLRISNPDRAVGMLPEIVRRALSSANLPLGEVLWSFAKDPELEAKQIVGALKDLKASEVEACREALVEVGATKDELAQWLPAVQPRERPAWITRNQILPAQPPRLSLSP